jgi:hypothetical protein
VGLVILFNVWSYDMKDAMDTMIDFFEVSDAISMSIFCSFSEYFQRVGSRESSSNHNCWA